MAAPVDEAVRMVGRANRDVRSDVFQWAVNQGHVLVELASDKRNLEDVFERLTLGAEAVSEE